MKTKDLEKLFRVLKSQRRLAVIKLMSDKKARSVGYIAAKLNMSLKAASKHLIILTQANFLEDKAVRNLVFYRLATDLSKEQRFLVSLIILSK